MLEGAESSGGSKDALQPTKRKLLIWIQPEEGHPVCALLHSVQDGIERWPAAYEANAQFRHCLKRAR
jgi:hypothetical protein